MKPLRVIISGGGTGGHIFPAVAIAQTIQKHIPNAEILFVGAEGKMEMEKVPAAGYEIIGLPIVGIQRKLTLKNLLVPIKIFQSLQKARRVIRDFKPDIAIGVGGYASGPLLRAAASMGIPTAIQEQNSYPGITNKILSKKAKLICVAYEGLDRFFPLEKMVLTGNPVRSDVAQIAGKRAIAQQHFGLDPHRKTVLVIGGSLGARTINQAVQAASVLFKENNIQVVWQTGKTYYPTAQAFNAQSGHEHIHVHEFIKTMDLAYACADVIVSRAGAMSISELCLIGKPTILVPSPNVAEDHQTKNAMALVQKEAALLIRDADAAEQLGAAVVTLINNETHQSTLSKNIAALGKPNAADDIVQHILRVIA